MNLYRQFVNQTIIEFPELSNIVWTGHDRRKERNKKTTKADPVVPPERSDDYTGPVTHLRSRRAGQ